MKKNKKLPPSHFLPLDREEKELMRAHEAGEYTDTPDSLDRVREMNAMLAEIRGRKEMKTTISLRTNRSSLETIKAFARQENVPYQTFLNSHIDRLANDLEKLIV